MRPWIHPGHMPVFVLLVIAAAACFILLAELRSAGRSIPGTARASRQLAYALGGLALLLSIGIVIFLITIFVGFDFGPFYLMVLIAAVMFVAIPALAIPPINERLERLSTPQLIWRATAVIAACLVLALLYVIVANSFGVVLRFNG